MALRHGFMIKRTTSGTLTLTAVEEAFDIQEIKVAGAAADTNYFKCIAKNTTMCVLPAYLLPFVPYGGSLKSLWKFIRERYPDFPTLKVLNGETFKVEPESTYSVLEVIYKVYDPGDIAPEAPGTRLSAVRPYVVSFYYSSDISASGEYEIDKALGEPEVPKYPLLERVPADVTLDIYAIAIYNKANADTKATYLRFWREETCLFDEDKKGLYIDPTVGNEALPYFEVSSGGTTYKALALHIFDEPLTLGPQEILTAKFDVEYDGTNALPSKNLMVTLIGVERTRR